MTSASRFSRFSVDMTGIADVTSPYSGPPPTHPSMNEAPAESSEVPTDVDEALRVMRECLRDGVIPRAITVGDVRIEVSGLTPRQKSANDDPPRPGSYLGRELQSRRGQTK